MKEKNAKNVADLVGGHVVGDPQASITGINTLRGAGGSDIAVLKEDKYSEEAAQSNAAVLIAQKEVEGFKGTYIIVEDAEAALAELLRLFYEETHQKPEGISEKAEISHDAVVGRNTAIGSGSIICQGATIGEGCVIYPMVYIGKNVRLGDNTSVYPHVTIMEGVEIGHDCSIKSNTVIGDQGFGFIQREGARLHRRLHHIGGVKVGNDVEIGSQCAIDRGMLDDTVIGDGCKIDKHCMIAHNCKIGKDCIFAGYARMAGSVEIGERVTLAADVRIRDHKKIGDNAVVAAGTGVTRDIEPGEQVWGLPPRSISAQTRIYACEGRLPELFKRVRKMEKKLESG